MKIYNTLPLLIQCLSRWTTRPTPEQFEIEYVRPVSTIVGDFFEDFYEVIEALDWSSYRQNALQLDPIREENRLRGHINAVETLFGFTLPGEVCLLGTFHTMDGFARFDRGQHRVYLGVDESHLNGKYIDILTVHELTHVARETRPEVWKAIGLDPMMPRKVYLESQTTIEHLMGEGFSCLVSELLVPGERPWSYAYQTADSWRAVQAQAPLIGKTIQSELRNPNGGYGHLYSLNPTYSHYVWAWHWTRQVLEDVGRGDPRQLVGHPSQPLIEHALQFKLKP